MNRQPNMPPVRTSLPAKPLKTERTHEENQERAYIAASRRSDRSLEARVESARRASEIHKRRTGRSLRVTEQDVINEEMYEEEDDDLPLHYRRLTAHLQTGSADFNRRLAAYLTNQVAMRSAMEQMVQNSYAPFPGGSYQPGPNLFPSPMIPQHSMGQSPSGSYRSAPYPSPHQPNFRQAHSRAYSMASMPNPQGPTSPSASGPSSSMDQRRMSTPASTTQEGKSDHDQAQQPQSATFSQNNSSFFPPLWQDMGPFTTSLPPESQQMLAQAPGFDHNDPTFANLMHGSEQFTSSQYYPWQNMQGEAKGMSMHPSAYPGMSATLAPGALEQTGETHLKANVSTPAPGQSTAPTPADTIAPPSAGLDFNFSQDSKSLGLGGGGGGGGGEAGASPGGDGFWDHFVLDGSWEDANDGPGLEETGESSPPSLGAGAG